MRYLITLVLFSFSAAAIAQQEPLISMFWNNYAYFNPAMSGLEYRHQASVNYRNQWNGVNGAPNSILGGYNAKIDRIHGGAGIYGMYETIGYNRVSKGLLNYSFQFKTGEEAVFSAGLGAGFRHLADNGSHFSQQSASYIPDQTSLNVNAGVAFHWRNLNAGVSITDFTSIYNQFWIFADYLFDLSPNFGLRPAVLVRADGAGGFSEFTLRGIVKQHYWIGVNFNPDRHIGGMIGWDIKGKFRVGYTYEHTLGYLSTTSKGTHEAVLGILLK